MLTHSQCSQLAQDLTARFVDRNPGQVLHAGLYGSTAKETDTPWSDLEMWFVVEDGCPAQGQHLVFRDTAVGYRLYPRRRLEELLQNPSEVWPFHMGALSGMKTLHGDPALVQTWLEMGESVPGERFRNGLEKALPGLVLESYGRILSSAQREDLRCALPSVWEVLFEMLTALCLLNRSWVQNDYYQGLEDSFVFPRLPEGYTDIVPGLYDAREFRVILPLADKLVNHFWRLMEEEGIQLVNYQSVEEIPL